MDETKFPPSPYMTPSEASAFLRITPGALANLRHKESGPPFLRYPSGALRYRLADITAWAEEDGLRKAATRRRKQGVSK